MCMPLNSLTLLCRSEVSTLVLNLDIGMIKFFNWYCILGVVWLRKCFLFAFRLLFFLVYVRKGENRNENKK